MLTRKRAASASQSLPMSATPTLKRVVIGAASGRVVTEEETQRLAQAQRVTLCRWLSEYYSEETRLALKTNTTAEEEARIHMVTKTPRKTAFRLHVEVPAVQQMLMAAQLAFFQLEQFRPHDVGDQMLRMLSWVSADAASTFHTYETDRFSLMHTTPFSQARRIGAEPVSFDPDRLPKSGSKRVPVESVPVWEQDVFYKSKAALARLLVPSQGDAASEEKSRRLRGLLGLGPAVVCPLAHLECMIRVHIASLIGARKQRALDAFARLPLQQRVAVGVFRMHELGFFSSARHDVRVLNRVTLCLPSAEDPNDVAWVRWCTGNKLVSLPLILQLAMSLAEQELGTADARTLEFACPSREWVERGARLAAPSPFSSAERPSVWQSLAADWQPLPLDLDWTLTQTVLWDLLLNTKDRVNIIIPATECPRCSTNALRFFLEKFETYLRVKSNPDNLSPEDYAWHVRRLYPGTFWWLKHASDRIDASQCTC